MFARRIRLEHWSSALNQGPAAARNMLGSRTPYERIPYFFSDQYDVGMEYSGYAPGWDQVVFRGDPAAGVHRLLAQGRAGRAGMNVNVWDVADSIAALVAGGAGLIFPACSTRTWSWPPWPDDRGSVASPLTGG